MIVMITRITPTYRNLRKVLKSSRSEGGVDKMKVLIAVVVVGRYQKAKSNNRAITHTYYTHLGLVMDCLLLCSRILSVWDSDCMHSKLCR